MVVKMWAVVYVSAVLVGVHAQTESIESKLVETNQGPVRGYKEADRELFAFYNIPYATVPTGEHRFQPPLPGPIWMQPFEAVNRGIMCPQTWTQWVEGVSRMQEDCLVANIFVPDTDVTNLPVVVNFHAGGHVVGFGNNVPLRNLVQTKQVIVVTFNARLGVHGFLCLGTKDIPGNAAMKDQVALLRWVRDNIANFGGNPNEVILMGCSAGGTSVDTLALSKMASGLFVRVITGSGPCYGSPSTQVDPLENAKSYARALNFTNVDDIEALENFYKTASFELLISRTTLINQRTSFMILFSPCVEADLGQERFLHDAPANIIKNEDYTKVPMLYGFTNMEGQMRLSSFPTWKDMMNDNFADFLPDDLQFQSEEEMNEIIRSIKSFYFNSQPVSEENVLGFIYYLTDIGFAYPVVRSSKERFESQNDTIYLYEYSFVDENTAPILDTGVSGARHCAQAQAVFDENPSTNVTQEYQQMVTIMRQLWLNFILTGNPNSESLGLPAWPPVGADRSPHMSLGRTIELRDTIITERAAFWDGIYGKYYRTPIPPVVPSGAPMTLSNITLALLLLFYNLLF